MTHSKIEIKTIGEAPSAFVQVLIDGHPIHGVRGISYKNDADSKVPIITLDMNAFDVSVDSIFAKLDIKHIGEIKEITFKDGHTSNFE